MAQQQDHRNQPDHRWNEKKDTPYHRDFLQKSSIDIPVCLEKENDGEIKEKFHFMTLRLTGDSWLVAYSVFCPARGDEEYTEDNQY